MNLIRTIYFYYLRLTTSHCETRIENLIRKKEFLKRAENIKMRPILVSQEEAHNKYIFQRMLETNEDLKKEINFLYNQDDNKNKDFRDLSGSYMVPKLLEFIENEKKYVGDSQISLSQLLYHRYFDYDYCLDKQNSYKLFINNFKEMINSDDFKNIRKRKRRLEIFNLIIEENE